MPVLEEQTALDSAKTKDQVQRTSEPLAGRQLLCPYCHVAYVPEEGCFCVRVVGWDGTPLGQ